MKSEETKHPHRGRFLKILLSVLLLITGCFLIWTADYYHADDTAKAVLAQDATIERRGNLTILPADNADAALIFYPGAKVEAVSYLPLLEKIRTRTGLTCILVRMPLNLAFFDINAADAVEKEFPQITAWYMGGHSLGGAMASAYASRHADRIRGLLLLGAYIYGSYPSAKTLTVYGTFNSDLEKNITYTDNIVKIEGGNHAQFGNYGRQKGDPDAAISADQQQEITAEAFAAFLARQ